MEIKPIANYTLPKFVLTLAAAVLAGSVTGCSLLDQHPQVMGVAPQPVETDVVLMGDMPVAEEPDTEPTDEPDFSEAVDQANLAGVSYEKEIMEGFAQMGIQLKPDNSGQLWVWRSTEVPDIVIGFFDGDVQSAGYNARDYMTAGLEPALDTQDWWGFVRRFPAEGDDPELRAVYIDICRCEGMTSERAAQIAQMVLN